MLSSKEDYSQVSYLQLKTFCYRASTGALHGPEGSARPIWRAHNRLKKAIHETSADFVAMFRHCSKPILYFAVSVDPTVVIVNARKGYSRNCPVTNCSDSKSGFHDAQSRTETT